MLNLSNEFLLEVGLFFLLQLVNVILSTMRSILTIKSSKHVAAIINAVSYTFYSAVVKLITSQDMTIIIAVTFLTNIIGVYIATAILKKMEKEKLWRISIVAEKKKIQKFHNELIQNQKSIKSFISQLDDDNLYSIDVLSETQADSLLIKELIDKYHLKYHIMEIDKRL